MRRTTRLGASYDLLGTIGLTRPVLRIEQAQGAGPPPMGLPFDAGGPAPVSVALRPQGSLSGVPVVMVTITQKDADVPCPSFRTSSC